MSVMTASRRFQSSHRPTAPSYNPPQRPKLRLNLVTTQPKRTATNAPKAEENAARVTG